MYDVDIISDLHKSAYGHRPAAGWSTAWESMTEAERQAEWDWLCAASEDAAREEVEGYDLTARRFEGLVADAIRSGASDRPTAIRWLAQAEGSGDGDEFGYHMGLPSRFTPELVDAIGR